MILDNDAAVVPRNPNLFGVAGKGRFGGGCCVCSTTLDNALLDAALGRPAVDPLILPLPLIDGGLIRAREDTVGAYNEDPTLLVLFIPMEVTVEEPPDTSVRSVGVALVVARLGALDARDEDETLLDFVELSHAGILDAVEALRSRGRGVKLPLAAIAVVEGAGGGPPGREVGYVILVLDTLGSVGALGFDKNERVRVGLTSSFVCSSFASGKGGSKVFFVAAGSGIDEPALGVGDANAASPPTTEAYTFLTSLAEDLRNPKRLPNPFGLLAPSAACLPRLWRPILLRLFRLAFATSAFFRASCEKLVIVASSRGVGGAGASDTFSTCWTGVVDPEGSSCRGSNEEGAKGVVGKSDVRALLGFLERAPSSFPSTGAPRRTEGLGLTSDLRFAAAAAASDALPVGRDERDLCEEAAEAAAARARRAA